MQSAYWQHRCHVPPLTLSTEQYVCLGAGTPMTIGSCLRFLQATLAKCQMSQPPPRAAPFVLVPFPLHWLFGHWALSLGPAQATVLLVFHGGDKGGPGSEGRASAVTPDGYHWLYPGQFAASTKGLGISPLGSPGGTFAVSRNLCAGPCQCLRIAWQRPEVPTAQPNWAGCLLAQELEHHGTENIDEGKRLMVFSYAPTLCGGAAL